MRTPLSRIRGLGAAHHGTEHFWMQRLTAAANLLLLVVLIGVVVTLVGRSHATVIATLSKPLIAVLLVAAVISVAMHMRIGMQVIIEDYVHVRWLEITLQIALRFGAALAALACVLAVLAIWLSGVAPQY